MIYAIVFGILMIIFAAGAILAVHEAGRHMVDDEKEW